MDEAQARSSEYDVVILFANGRVTYRDEQRVSETSVRLTASCIQEAPALSSVSSRWQGRGSELRLRLELVGDDEFGRGQHADAAE